MLLTSLSQTDPIRHLFERTIYFALTVQTIRTGSPETAVSGKKHVLESLGAVVSMADLVLWKQTNKQVCWFCEGPQFWWQINKLAWYNHLHGLYKKYRECWWGSSGQANSGYKQLFCNEIKNHGLSSTASSEVVWYVGSVAWKFTATPLLRRAGRMGLNKQLILQNPQEADLMGLTPSQSVLETWTAFFSSTVLGIPIGMWI